MAIIGTSRVAQVLRDFVVEYKNEEYIGTQVLPPVPVKALSDSYYIFDKTNSFNLEDTYRGPKAEAGYSDWSTSTETYSCRPHAWKEFLADLDYQNADPPIQAQMVRAEYCANTVLLGQEKRISDLVMAAGTYDDDHKMTLTAGGTSDGYQFDKYTKGGTSIFNIIEEAKANCYHPGNAEAIMVMNGETFRILKHHPAILARITGGATKERPATIMKRTMAELFDVADILVGEAQYNSTPNQASATYSYLWGRNVLVAYRAKSPAREAAGLGYTFIYNPGGNSVGDVPGVRAGWRVRPYREDKIGGGGRWVEVEQYPDEKIVCADCGCLIQNAIGSVTPA